MGFGDVDKSINYWTILNIAHVYIENCSAQSYIWFGYIRYKFQQMSLSIAPDKIDTIAQECKNVKFVLSHFDDIFWYQFQRYWGSQPWFVMVSMPVYSPCMGWI